MKAEFAVQVAKQHAPADFAIPIEEAIRGCSLSGIGVEGMSEYEVKTVEFDLHADPMKITVEAEWIGGQFVSRKELTEILREAICSVEDVLGDASV